MAYIVFLLDNTGLDYSSHKGNLSYSFNPWKAQLILLSEPYVILINSVPLKMLSALELFCSLSIYVTQCSPSPLLREGLVMCPVDSTVCVCVGGLF